MELVQAAHAPVRSDAPASRVTMTENNLLDSYGDD